MGEKSPNIPDEASGAIGLLGGSFDPLHNGHLAIVRSFLECSDLELLWILPAPKPPHKQYSSQAAYSSRFKMLQEAFSDWDRVVVSDLEDRLPRPSYTVQTLEYLSGEYPDQSFYLCLGEDSARDFKDWHRWKDILSYCNLLVASRSTDKPDALQEPIKSQARFVPHQPIDISSTEIRQLVKQGKDVSSLVPPTAAYAIENDSLYQ